MRIVIDASRTTVAARTGTENYALQLIRALLELRAPHQFVLCFRDKPPAGLFNTYHNVQHKVIPFQRLWTHIRFASVLWSLRPDVTFVPAHTLPIFFPGRSVVTVHDLGYLYFPDAHPPAERRYLDSTTRYSARRATRILADSEATKHDLIAKYEAEGSKINVVYPGVEGLQRVSPAQINAMRTKYKLPDRYFLFLGTLQPRKNIERLIQAFTQFVNTPKGDPGIGLVLAGKRGWLIDNVLLSIPESIKSRVVLPGYIDDTDISAIYSGALGLVFPSLYEGFGFPVIEAMRCGAPVLCANTSSLPELAGDAGILVDPLSVDAIAEGLYTLSMDGGLRAKLIERGYHQSEQFTWKHAAEQTLQALESAAHR